MFSSPLVFATQHGKRVPNIIVKNITYKIDDETEKVIIELNRATTPIVFDINGNNPRIVIDIMNVLPCKGRYRTPVNGKLIKQIRAYYHMDSEKLRVVLDLYPGHDYILSNIRTSQSFLIELKPSGKTNFEWNIILMQGDSYVPTSPLEVLKGGWIRFPTQYTLQIRLLFINVVLGIIFKPRQIIEVFYF